MAMEELGAQARSANLPRLALNELSAQARSASSVAVAAAAAAVGGPGGGAAGDVGGFAYVLSVAAVAFCGCATVYALSKLMSPVVFGRFYSDLEYGKQVYWNLTIVALIPNVLVPLMELPDIWLLLTVQSWDANLVMTMAPTPSFLRAFGLGIGYLIFDLAGMLLCRSDLLASRAMGKDMYHQMIGHHVVSLMIWPYAVANHLAIGYITYLLSTEFTSVWMNLRWIHKALKQDKLANAAFVFVAVMFLLSYTVIRVIPIPWVLWLTVRFDKSKMTWYEAFVAWVTIPIPALLNGFWYNLILKGVVQMLRGPDKKHETEAKATELGKREEV
mmetsp:Transcript_22842/g.77819  ORF Transcript_22842/g.77819 Transcript_22842/m.77819 type:complete len:330 (+) Transcript_22842:16-1005(+)